jgi:hypothetical protein
VHELAEDGHGQEDGRRRQDEAVAEEGGQIRPRLVDLESILGNSVLAENFEQFWIDFDPEAINKNLSKCYGQ